MPVDGGAQGIVTGAILLLYVLSWVLGSEMVQFVENQPGENYEKPAFISFLNHSGLIVFLPAVSLLNKRRHGDENQQESLKAYLRRWAGCRTVSHLFFVYGLISIVYNVCIYCWVRGLQDISVSLSNGLYQLQTLFALIFSKLFLNVEFSRRKKLGLMLAILGVIVVCVPPIFDKAAGHKNDNDNDEGNEKLWSGCLWTFASALGWGMYEVAFDWVIQYKRDLTHTHAHTHNHASAHIQEHKHETKEEEIALTPFLETLTCLSFVGLGTFFFFGPCLILLDITGVERFGLPQDTVQWRNVMINLALSFIFDFFFALAIFKTEPIVVSIVASLVIPTSFIADFIFHGEKLSLLPFVGSGIVLYGLYYMSDNLGERPSNLATASRLYSDETLSEESEDINQSATTVHDENNRTNRYCNDDDDRLKLLSKTTSAV